MSAGIPIGEREREGGWVGGREGEREEGREGWQYTTHPANNYRQF